MGLTEIGHECVLVVEDTDNSRELLLDCCEDSGVAAAGVGNGREAIQYLEHCSELPRLILLDLFMPVCDGFQFLAWLKEQPKAVAEIPVFILSGAGDLARKTAQTSRVAGFFPKPVDFDALLPAMERVLGRDR